jgi:hypothetical protein
VGKTDSVSSILEQHRGSIDRAIVNYYSSLTDEEVAEQAEWGDFALRQFPEGQNPQNPPQSAGIASSDPTGLT